MLNLKKILVFIPVVLLLCACSLTRSSGTATPAPVGTGGEEATLPPVGIADLGGTWTGTLSEQGKGSTYDLELTLAQAADNTVSGGINITSVNTLETYTISGDFDGTTLHFQESDGRFFTASLAGDTLNGYVGWDEYDKPESAWGQYTLTRGTSGGNGAVATFPPVAADPQGTWIGSLNTNDGLTYFTMLVIAQEAEGSLTGYFTWVVPTFGEYDPMQGSLNGTTLHLQNEQYGRTITATLAGDTISGYAANDCLDCPEQAFGQLSLQRTVSTVPDLDPSSAPLDMVGTWTGKIIFSNENTGQYDMTMAITQPAGDPVINGQVTFTQPALNNQETMTIYGQALGPGLFFDEASQAAGARQFWGTVNGNRINGYLGVPCSGCEEFIGALFSIVRE